MKSARLQAGRRRGGFSLLEVVVALAILSFGIVALSELLSGSLRTVKKADEQGRALVHASSVLEEAMASDDLAGLQGLREFDDGMEAEISVAPYSKVEGGESAVGSSLGKSSPVTVTLYKIRVRVGWPGGGSVSLEGTRAINDREE